MDKGNKPFVPKSPMDFQKLKLERLMANPDKPVIIPDMPKEKKGFSVPEFVRNVMGSSAGAGSGEFHVYRHLRRKEYTRQKMIDEKAEKERLDEEFQKKLEDNKRKMDERTGKKRAKRLKKKAKLKQKQKGAKCQSKTEEQVESSSEESDEQSEQDETESASKSMQEGNEDSNSPQNLESSVGEEQKFSEQQSS